MDREFSQCPNCLKTEGSDRTREWRPIVTKCPACGYISCANCGQGSRFCPVCNCLKDPQEDQIGRLAAIPDCNTGDESSMRWRSRDADPPEPGDTRTIKKFVILRKINGEYRALERAKIVQKFERKFCDQDQPIIGWVDQYWAD